MGSSGSAAGNYDIIKGLCYLGVKNKERKERMGKQQVVGHKILSAFTQKTRPVNYTIGCFFKGTHATRIMLRDLCMLLCILLYT